MFQRCSINNRPRLDEPPPFAPRREPAYPQLRTSAHADLARAVRESGQLCVEQIVPSVSICPRAHIPQFRNSALPHLRMPLVSCASKAAPGLGSTVRRRLRPLRIRMSATPHMRTLVGQALVGPICTSGVRPTFPFLRISAYPHVRLTALYSAGLGPGRAGDSSLIAQFASIATSAYADVRKSAYAPSWCYGQLAGEQPSVACQGTRCPVNASSSAVVRTAISRSRL